MIAAAALVVAVLALVGVLLLWRALRKVHARLELIPDMSKPHMAVRTAMKARVAGRNGRP